MNIPSSSVLWNKLRSSRAYRRAFAASQFKRLVPFQIGALRRGRGWSQAQLANASGLTQGVVSRAEDQDYGNLTVNTILRIADGFDVAFIGKFVPFSELEKLVDHLSDKEFVLGFDLEDAIQNSPSVPEESDQTVISIDRALEGRRNQGRQKEGGLEYENLGRTAGAGAGLY